VLGGRDPRDSRAAVDGAGSRGARQAAPAEGAGGTLRSRLLEPPAPPSQGGATRPDARPPNSGTAEGDQVEIPISVAHSDYAFDPSAPARTPDSDEFVEDVPTQVFRPGTHPAPRPRTAPPAPPPTASSREVSATHVSPLAIPPDRASGRAPGPPDRFDDISARRLVAPPEETSEVEDEWDGATEITRPADMALKHPLARPQHAADARRPEPRPFNPDETVKLNGDLAAYGVGPGLPRRQR
jgi:hypothetical protein